MLLYFPITEMSVDVLLILAIGTGFLMTSLLILVGVSPPVATGSEAAQISAASASAGLAHLSRGNVNLRPVAASDDVYSTAPAGAGTPISRMHTGLPPDLP